tara:strand:+ start:7261 stop:7569 length:309 start_codon:yes stop_codon:yes gene_type:complete
MNRSIEETPVKQPEPAKKPPIKADSLIAAGGTATGSLLIWVVSQIMSMESIVQKLAATQNQLVDETGLIRPSTVAIRAEIQIEELYARLDRLERALVVRGDD